MELKSKGFGTLEIVIAAAIVAAFLGGLWFSYLIFWRTALDNLKTIKAAFLLEEGVEILKFLKKADWQNLADLPTGTERALIFADNQWLITEPPVLVDELFDRRFILEDVYRDNQGRLAPSGSLDPGTKQVAVSVSWQRGDAVIVKSVVTYLADS